MCLLVVMDTLFIFWFLRIFSSLTKIVVLLAQVFGGLRDFFMFIVLMLIFFSQIPSIIGMGNVRIPGPFQDNFIEYVHLSDETCPSEFMTGYMYTNIGLFMGNFFDMARLALGDFYMIEQAQFLEFNEAVIFWCMFFVALNLLGVIMLNILIAETGSSYNKITSHIDEYIESQKAGLINESEIMLFQFQKVADHYPKYLIIR